MQGTFPVLSFEKLLLMHGSTARPDVCPQPIAEAAMGLVFVVIFPSPWGKSQFGALILSGLFANCCVSGPALNGL